MKLLTNQLRHDGSLYNSRVRNALIFSSNSFFPCSEAKNLQPVSSIKVSVFNFFLFITISMIPIFLLHILVERRKILDYPYLFASTSELPASVTSDEPE